MSGYQPYSNFNSDKTGYGGNYNDDGQSAGGAGFSADGAGSSSQQRSNNTNTITPVTIKEINDAYQPGHDAPYQSHGLELHYVSFIGIIREVDSSQAHSSDLKVEDGTGSVSFRAWHDEGEEDPSSVHRNGDYVRVVATIREFGNKKQVQTQVVQKITDFNEIPYHFLSAAKVYLQANGANAPTGSGGDYNAAGASTSAGATTAGTGAANTDNILEFIQRQSAVMTEGVPFQLIAQNFEVPEAELEGIINNLMEDGRLYNGIEDTNYLTV